MVEAAAGTGEEVEVADRCVTECPCQPTLLTNRLLRAPVVEEVDLKIRMKPPVQDCLNRNTESGVKRRILKVGLLPRGN